MKFIVNGRFALYVENILLKKNYYKDYKAGKTTQEQFCTAMLNDTSLAETAGFGGEYNIRRIAKTPPDEKLPAEHIFGFLAENKIITYTGNLYEGFGEYRKYILENYDHGEFVTYVFPEDELLMYAAAQISQPKRVFMAGSYYGYLAVWAMQTVKKTGGTAILSDIDAEVCALAEKNFKKLGFENNSEIYCHDAAALLSAQTEPVDMLILDATGFWDDPRPNFRGKRIYGALLKAARHLLKKGSVIYIHNMETEPENSEMRELTDGLTELGARGAGYETFNGLGLFVVC